MRHATLFILFLSAAFSTPILAKEASQTYIEMGYANISYKESGVPEYTIPAIKATFGVVVSEGLAVEGFVAAGVGTDTQTYENVPIKLSLDSAYGIYARPFIKIGDGAELFGRLGFAQAKLTGSTGNVRISIDGNDFSYGVGAAFNVSKSTAIIVDYMTYYDKGDIDITGFGLGVKIEF